MNKQILRLAVPNIISNLSVPLLSAVDTALVGHLPSLYYIGAVAVGTLIFNFVYWGFGFLRMGATGLTAQACGRDDKTESMLILGRSLLVAALTGVILILLQTPIAWISFNLVGASAGVEEHARIYFYIRIYAAPATLSLYAIQGWFLGMQNARYPLITTVAVNVLNIIFNLIFILGMGMNSNGVALGTVLAQYAGVFISILLFKRMYSTMLVHPEWTQLLNLAALKKFFIVNSDIMIRTLALIFAFSFFTAKSAEFGNDILAVNTILMQLWMIFSYGIDGFAFAAESLVGKAIGANDRNQLKSTIRLIFIWGTGLGLIFSLTYFIFDETLLAIFTNKENIILLALTFMPWTIIAPLINSVCYIWDGIYIGATATSAMRNAMLFVTLSVFLPLYYLTHQSWGNHGLWFTMTVFMLMRGVMLSLLYRKNILKAPID